MKPFEEQFTAWVDGKLTEAELAEFEKHLAEHPEAAEEKEAALQIGQLLRAHPTAPRLSNPDFFNHQVMQRIAAEMPQPVEKKRPFFWSLPRSLRGRERFAWPSRWRFQDDHPSGRGAGEALQLLRPSRRGVADEPQCFRLHRLQRGG